MDQIVVPTDLSRISEPELLALAAKCAQVQSAALTELQARPARQSDYEKRLLMLPPWRQTLVKALSSKMLIACVAIAILFMSLAGNIAAFSRDKDVQGAVKAKVEELHRLDQERERAK